MAEYFVYILKSLKDNSYYKGITQNLANRLKEHNTGEQKYTSSKTPWKIIWNCKKPNKSEACILENKLKNLSRKRIEEFILKYPSCDSVS